MDNRHPYKKIQKPKANINEKMENEKGLLKSSFLFFIKKEYPLGDKNITGIFL